MVIYYSATGNSKHVALRVQEVFKGDLVDICEYGQPSSFYLEDEETLFFVTFNCFWGISAHMEAFIRENEFKNVSKIVAILTCGGYLGGADGSLEKIFFEKGLPEPTVYSLAMVTNYSILHDIPKLKAQKKKLLRSEKVLDKILKGEQKPYLSNRFIRGITPKIHGEYEKKRTTVPFSVNDACISCGLCVKNCPVHAMGMGERKPSWVLPKCDNCLRCLHRCPVEAINYGESTQKRLRYTYESCFTER